MMGVLKFLLYFVCSLKKYDFKLLCKRTCLFIFKSKLSYPTGVFFL